MHNYTGLAPDHRYAFLSDHTDLMSTPADPDGIVPHTESNAKSNKKHVKYTSKTPFTPTYLLSAISVPEGRGSSSQKATKFYEERIKRRVLPLENPAREGRIKKEAAAKKKRQDMEKERKALGVLGRDDAIERGTWKLSKEEARYDLFIPLHQLWLGYMSELLALASPPTSGTPPSAQAMPKAEPMHAKLIKADYHGCIITVVRAKNPCLVGLSGIVVHETENAFRVITNKNQTKTVPKQNSVLSFVVPLYSTLQPSTPPALNADRMNVDDMVRPKTVYDFPHIKFELYGNQFQFRASERAGRKFKHKETIEL